MAQSTIFGAQTPAGTFNDATAYTMGTRFTPGVAGWATHGRWYFPSTLPGSTVSCGVYRNSDQVLLGSATFSSPTVSAWNTAVFSSPIALSAGVVYTAVIWTPDRYVATSSYPWPSGAGDLVSDAVGAGRFDAAGSPFVFPTSNANGSYFVDVVFETVLSSDVIPAGIAVPVALGSPTAALNRTAAPAGLAVPVALGVPSVSLNRSAAPTGIAVPVGLGVPTVGRNGAAPAGLAVAVALGSPSVSLNRSAAPSGLAVAVTLGSPSPVAAAPGITPRPNTGTTARPNTGITPRP